MGSNNTQQPAKIINHEDIYNKWKDDKPTGKDDKRLYLFEVLHRWKQHPNTQKRRKK